MKRFLLKSGFLIIVFFIANKFFYPTLTIPKLDYRQVSEVTFNVSRFLSG